MKKCPKCGRIYDGDLSLEKMCLNCNVPLVEIPDVGGKQIRGITPQETKECPFCAEEIQYNAKLCRYCGKSLVKTQPSLLMVIFSSAVVLTFVILGLFFVSNLLARRDKSIGEGIKQIQIEDDKKTYEQKFLEISFEIVINTESALKILNGISEVWQLSIEYSRDFNEDLKEFLAKTEDYHLSLEETDKRIISGMKDLKDYPVQFQEAYKVLVELFTIYRQIYSLAQNPSGSLVSFNMKVNDLSSEFTKKWSQLEIYIPKLKEEGDTIAEK